MIERSSSDDSTGSATTGDISQDGLTAWELSSRLGNSALPSDIGTLGRYRLIREIGRGGHGIVFLAYDDELKRDVAVKVARPEVSESPIGVQRFQTEASEASRLQHPGIVSIFDCGTQRGLHFYVMPYLPHPNLGQWMNQQTAPLDERFIADLMIALCDAVHYGHVHNVIHRDIKPQNILLHPDENTEIGYRPMLLDFGLCGSVESPAQSTSMLAGTPRYMSPEQAMFGRRPITVRTDLYSLGVILYELLTKQTPHQPQSIPEAILLLHETPITSPRQYRPDLSTTLETICMKCLRIDPYQRYESAKQLCDDLNRFLDGDSIQARPQRLSERLDFAVRYGDWEQRIGWSIIGLNIATYIWAIVGAIVIGSRFADRANVQSGLPELLIFLCAVALPIHALGIWTGWLISKRTSSYRWLTIAAVGSLFWSGLHWLNFYRSDKPLQIYEGQEFAQLMVFMLIAATFTIQAILLSIAAWSSKCRAASESLQV